MSIPRSEYPRPQFVRNDWLCLNGVWQFEIDGGDSGIERGLLEKDLKDTILVPFCPESELSGVGCTDFMAAVWYRKQMLIPADWSGREVLLHFQAVDYDATVWVNGLEVARHRGPWCGFTCNLAGVAEPGKTAVIVVRAREPRHEPRPAGKQSIFDHDNAGCLYTRTSGIWQSVWMEPVPTIHLDRPRVTPDPANNRFMLTQPVTGNTAGVTVRATLLDDKGDVRSATCLAGGSFTPMLDLPIPDGRRRLWSPEDPFCYDLQIELLDAAGQIIDRADSYAGLRSVTIDDKAVLINGRAVFQRLVLDQGYWPDGIMTAPSDEALKRDIELSISAGFNGARLHQKVFEERFLYHADRLGYLVWGEFGDWGCQPSKMNTLPNPHHHQPAAALITQWLEVLGRDYNHPCIIGWCPLNETHQDIEDNITCLDDMTLGTFLAVKASDPTRPVLDASGYSHRVAQADIFDCHDYAQEPDKLRANQAPLVKGKPFSNNPKWSISYRGQPFFVSEFGGIWWNPEAVEDEDSWGYGNRPASIEEFHERFEGLCGVLLDNPNMFGYCYTQLTDVFQEQNGIFHFDRRSKFDLNRIRKAQLRPAAIEQKTR